MFDIFLLSLQAAAEQMQMHVVSSKNYSVLGCVQWVVTMKKTKTQTKIHEKPQPRVYATLVLFGVNYVAFHSKL